MRGIFAAVFLAVLPSAGTAAPITFNYSLPFVQTGPCCAGEPGEPGWGETAEVSVTFDNATFDAWRWLGPEALLDFTIVSGDYSASLAQMAASSLLGQWSNLPGSVPAFSLWASQNVDGDDFPPGLTINILHAFYNSSDFAELGRAGSMSSMADYAVFASAPSPIPLPPAAALLPGALAVLWGVARRRRYAGPTWLSVDRPA